ncbi:hypothetical protein SAMN05216464_105178 [Mucilaginibacter pineti]|uniref:Uncharacterized protein n=1 Tax=Mucilaginibacter pineti TaxID=1391627 RepID=A0A1G7BWG7_9SPHI|nr:hypothetical protein [Mucilaginibacter pineti]SDE30910.1 hypothetical protein SAMN05216464_105178 [Mucilaginibacter pineti]
MIRYFPLDNTHNKLYAEIGETIKEHYPIGVINDTPEYKEHPGIKKIMAIISENAAQNKKFNKPWIDFLKKLRSGSKKKIYNNSLLTDVAFSGELILESYEDNALFRTKKIIFSVSLIAPFFSICGVDETAIKERGDGFKRAYPAINVITESPFEEFENDFIYVQTEIEKKFTGYKLVPVRVSMCHVKDLHTPNLSDKLHNALFNGYFDFNHVQFFRGEMYYGSGPGNITVQMLPPPPIV